MIQVPAERDIIIRTAPRRSRGTPDQRSREAADHAVRQYDAFVYTRLPLAIQLGGGARIRADEERRGLPLRGVGQLQIKWHRYQDLLAQFFDGDKGVEAMYYRMRDTLSPSLRDLVDHVRTSDRALRVWWTNDTPELDDMPWDLLFYGQYGDRQHFGPARTSCVRGMPPVVPPPILTVPGSLRVLWDAGPFTPGWLREVFMRGIPNLECVPFDGPARAALLRTRSEGFELLHLSVDGVVSLAYEGVLYRHGDPVPQLSAGEVSQLTGGSRLALLSLSDQVAPSVDVVQISNREVASAFRSFAYFASTKVTLPSMVLPIGPTPKTSVTAMFWETFYRELATSHDAERALALARFEAPASPHSLFLRHAQGELFRGAETTRRKVEHPERLAMLMRGFVETNKQVQALSERYGELPDYVHDLLSDEKERQADVEADLEDWARPEGDKD